MMQTSTCITVHQACIVGAAESARGALPHLGHVLGVPAHVEVTAGALAKNGGDQR